MSWLGLLLLGIALGDLIHSAWPARWVPEVVAATFTVGLGLLAALVGPADLVALAVIAMTVVAWGWLVRWETGPDRVGVPLVLLAAAVAAGVLVAPMAGTGGGAVGRWLAAVDWPWLVHLRVDQFLLLLGVVALQGSTGNVIVRLVLTATRTVNPMDAAGTPGGVLKGGRLLGPMERLVIVGLGLAGQVAAASLVIAAKGLIRWPEIQSFRRSGDDRAGGPSITDVTEYFLVGSFVSWLVALGGLALTGA